MLALSLECGITTLSWYAALALRRRVSMSAIGSVIVMVTSSLSRRGSQPVSLPGLRRRGLPGGLVDAGQLAAVRHLADAHPAEPELAEHRARAAAPLAARVAAHPELGLLGR